MEERKKLAFKLCLEAREILLRKFNDVRNIAEKSANDYVTDADLKIEKYLIDSISAKFKQDTIISEEKGTLKGNTEFKWIIDPLDGTNSFKNQRNTWGVMVGACDMNGVLRYSYNIISTGEIYKTERGNKLKLKSFKQLKKSGKYTVIDVYDYGSGALDLFNNLYKKTSYPAAIWAGWQLYQQKLNGLLWLPSNQGKKWYPDYDLIFLGALLDKGYNIIIGKKGKNNSMIAIGPTLKDTERLYEIGLNLFPVSERLEVKKIINKLKIVN